MFTKGNEVYFLFPEIGKHISFFICGGIYSKVTQNEWHLIAYT